MTRLCESELEFLYAAWARSGSPKKLENRGFRVKMYCAAWSVALSLSERGFISQPLLCGSADHKRFTWLEPGIRMMQAYVDMLHNDANRPKPKPTRAMPGSEEKIEELRRRASAGEDLWHDSDVVPRCLEAERVWKT